MRFWMMFILKREVRSLMRAGEMKSSFNFRGRVVRSSSPDSVMGIRKGRAEEDM